jgi:hypothetical protein
MVTVDFRFHRATAERWLEEDPVLDETEIGYERATLTTPARFKMGDGFSKWSQLPYFTPGDGGSGSGDITYQDLLDHIESLTPHPVYDDGPSLELLYQNAKV